MLLRDTFIFLMALAATSTATPLRRRCSPRGSEPPTPPATGVTYVLPSTGGPVSLPSPNTTVKHIAIGHGVQNYTCTATGAMPASAGALAVLYDIIDLYPGTSGSALSQAAWDTLTSSVLRTTTQPITDSSFPAPEALWVPGLNKNLPFLGHHFFNGASVPTFAVVGGNTMAVQKVQGIPAPNTADTGLENEGAVDWLYLADSYGGTKVYRVLTSGGAPTACQEVGEVQSVDYSAMYWLY